MMMLHIFVVSIKLVGLIEAAECGRETYVHSGVSLLKDLLTEHPWA